MTKATRRTLMFGILGVVAVFFIANPFNLFNQPGSPELPVADSVTIESSANELLRAKQDPKTLVANLFNSNDIVVVGEFGRIKEEILFTASLVPALADKGVQALGVEYLLAKDQDQIDKLMAASTFDEALAAKLIYNRYVMWGYQEYVALLKAAWAANTNRDPENPRFRLVGLNVKPDNSFITKEEDARDPAIMKKVFGKGLPDSFMAQTVLQTMKAKPDGLGVSKMLLFVNRDSSFTKWADLRFVNEVKRLDLGETRRTAQILFEAKPGKVATVLLHSPWPDKTSPVTLPNATYITRVGFPASGLLDRVISFLDNGKAPAYPFAIDLKTSTLGNISLFKTDYLDSPSPTASPNANTAVPSRSAKLSDFGDVYVVLGPIAGLSPVQPIANFINETNIKQTLMDFSPQDRDKINAQNINDAIAHLSTEMSKGLARFAIPKK